MSKFQGSVCFFPVKGTTVGVYSMFFVEESIGQTYLAAQKRQMAPFLGED